LVEDIDTVFISKVTDGNFAGADVVSSSVRKYETSYAAHILGTVGPLYAEDLENPLYADYPRDATVGKSGVESAFESYLKGTDGRRVISTNSDGKITGEYYSREPQPGNTVELTIDLELQKAVEDALAETVTAMNEKDGLVERGAGAVVEKIGTGEILALASYPTYDLSTFRQSEIWAELSANPGKPFQNRATQGTYPPGSTFKMLTAAAALEEGVVGLKEEIRDTGKWYYPDIVEGTARWGYNCWNRGGHGKVDVREAITVSCNYFFYEMGYRLGIDRLSDWAARFGFGEPTGIEIGDAGGILASREEREERGGVWYGGDTVMAAIGQSDNLFTPIQLSNYICTLISGGERYETRLLKAVKTYDNAEVVAVGDTKPVETINLSDSTLAAIKEGMHNLTTTGSLSYYFKDCIVSAGAKTGTAQLGENLTDNGMFVCFAPYENPEIAVAVAIEKGGSGSALASTAVKILNAYFSADEIGTAIIPENQLLP
jgi:penicillin-binding protein 2